MEKKKDLFWLLIMFIGFGLLWYIGNSNKNSQSGNSFSLRNGYSSGSQKERGVKGTTTEDIQKEIRNTEQELEKVQREIEKIKEEATRSSLYGALSLSSAGARGDIHDEYIKISISSSKKQVTKITGMVLYSPITGRSVRLDRAAVLPRIGESNTLEDVEVGPGDVVYVSTGSSPLGFSFRTNKCTGYLTQYQDYSPELKRSCPSPDEEAEHLQTEPALTSACLEYIEDIPRCEIPKKIGNAPGTNCQNFIRSNLNYNACVSNHIGDSDFPKKEWRIYLNKPKELWREDNDIIELLDTNGKIIDSVSY